MKEIILSRGKVALVDDEDFEWLNQWKWSFLSGGYAVRRSNHSSYIYMHRLILGCEHRSQFADHIDGNRLNNTRSNLRMADPTTNTYNKGMHSRNVSGYKGVRWEKRRKKWVAQIQFRKKGFFLGYFSDPKEAHVAYCAKARELFGEFARFE